MVRENEELFILLFFRYPFVKNNVFKICFKINNIYQFYLDRPIRFKFQILNWSKYIFYKNIYRFLDNIYIIKLLTHIYLYIYMLSIACADIF